MHITTTLILLATALSGVSAHPSAGHSLHRHAHTHDKRATELTETSSPLEERFSKSRKKYWRNKRPSRPKHSRPPPSNSGGRPTNTPPKPSGGGGGAGYKPFCGGLKMRATDEDISYKGNTGAGRWGCNIMEIDCGLVDVYDYTAKFESTDGDYSCSAFNKIGPTGEINGFWHSALDFTISKGTPKCIAFDKNSQGGIACGAGRGGCPKTSLGQLAGTWLEFDAGSNRNADNSGSDVSVLVAGAYNMPYVGMSIKDPLGRHCSWVKSNGDNHAAYMPGMEALDGVGCTGYYKGMLDIKVGDAF